MSKRIYLASRHSFIDVSRVDDDLHGPMIEIDHQHPEVDVRHRFSMTQDAAKELIKTLENALVWMNPQPYAEKHPKDD